MGNVMVILDGMQDIAYPQLGGKTPYDFGKRESFSAFEAASATGTLRTTPPGWEADTQTCVLTLLGVAPSGIPSGRSYIEALAVGIPVGDNDIIMRCNFVEVDEDGILTVPCCGAPAEIAAALRAEVAAQEGHSVTPVGPYKSLQLISGGRRYFEGLVTSIPHQNKGRPLEELLPHGNALADQLADFSRKMYNKYKPYTVFNWGVAVKGELPAFADLHSGMSGAMVSKTDAPIGAAVAMGMACPPLPGATGDTDTDLAAKLEATLALLGERDFVMLHIGGPDEATHRQDPIEKAAFITRLDEEIIGPLMRRVPAGTRMMVTCDHEALCSTAGHTDKPVRFWLWQKGGSLSGELGELEGTRAAELLRG